jgi:diacylglycerol kinase family enzyme
LKVRLIVNRGGGSFSEEGAERLKALFEERGVEADLRLVDPDSLADSFADAASAEGLDAVVAAGGDGTVSAAAAALADSGRPLGLVPLGTLNHFARDAGIPIDPAAAIAAIAGGVSRPVDLAEVNGRIFVNNSALGLYPFLVRSRESQQRRLGRSKRLAMLVASLRALRRFSRRRLTIVAGGDRAPIETPLLFVGNNRYETRLLSLGRRAALDQGELCLYAPLARSRRHFLLLALRSLVGRLDQVRDFVNLEGLDEIEVRSRFPTLSVANDGETVILETPLRYRIRPRALLLLGSANPTEEAVSGSSAPARP